MWDAARTGRSARCLSMILISCVTADARRLVAATAIRHRDGKSWRMDLASEFEPSE